jgi:hypothetical protein
LENDLQITFKNHETFLSDTENEDKPILFEKHTYTFVIFKIKFTKLGYFLNLSEFYGTELLLKNYGTQLLFLAFDEIIY